MNTPIRCFVAMAVGRADTDRIYDKHILPTLRAAGIHTIFMGRLEHNDDIDKRIIREIEECDFVIADLTYVRPSVYFEAGYAQRKVPVIYTCRTDHLGQGTGELRVHFDLLMRNIVGWSSPTDRSFSTKLAKRIKIVIRPLTQQRESDAKVKAAVDDFQRIPLVTRIDIMTGAFQKVLERSGYRSLVVNNRPMNPWVGRLPKREVLNLCIVSAQSDFTKRKIADHVNQAFGLVKSRFESFDNDFEGYNRVLWQNKWGHFVVPRAIETRNVERIVLRLVLCSLQKIPTGRLVSALPSSVASAGGQVYSWSQTCHAAYSKALPATIFVHVVAPVLSEPDIAVKSHKLRQVIKTEANGLEEAKQ